MLETGHGVQVVKVKEDHSYELDEKVLEQVLLNNDIKDLPVVVVSVAGAYRGGKSFLLNFFLRYFSSSQSAREDGSWLGKDSEPLVGFSWRGGSKRHTTGIHFWSKPFINTLPNGEKVAVLLMDTQGTFDSKSTVRDNSTIFALSTLVSSVQIYNLAMNIKEDDLQHLQLFTTYGKMVQEKNQKAFQTLEFLVRDWPYPDEYAYGTRGGNELLQKRLEITNEQPLELKELRTHIRSSFENIICFLMPHPGLKVSKAIFKGNLKDIEPDFRIHVKELVTSLLSSEKMSPKTINGERVKAGELFNYFKAYMHAFNSHEIFDPRSIMQATAEAGLMSSTNDARDVYEKGMGAECGPTKPGVPPGDVQELHEKYLGIARIAFAKKKTMASQEQINECLEKLNTELISRLAQFEQSNLSKLEAVIKEASVVYEQTISNVSKGQPLCLHPLDLEVVHREGTHAALKIYDERVKRISSKVDQKRVEFTQNIEEKLILLKNTNDHNNKSAMKDVHADYWKFMETKSEQSLIPDADFKRSHEVGLKQALVKFQTKRNRPNSYPSDVYEEDLTKEINDTFSRLQATNLQKIEQENIRKEQERQRIEQQMKKAELARQMAEQARIEKEQAMARLAREKERAEEERKRRERELQEAIRREKEENQRKLLEKIRESERAWRRFKEKAAREARERERELRRQRERLEYLQYQEQLRYQRMHHRREESCVLL